MNYELFGKLYLDALEYDNLDTYVSTQENKKQANDFNYPDELLKGIYKLAYMSLQELRESKGLSRANFSRIYNISVDKLENWESLGGQVPIYVEILIAYSLFNWE